MHNPNTQIPSNWQGPNAVNRVTSNSDSQSKNPGGFFLIGSFSKISMQYLFRLSKEKKIYGVGLGQESKPTLAFYDISYKASVLSLI